MITTLSIPGIHCDACATLIKDVSADFPEIKDVAVDTTSKRVTLDHSDSFPKERWIDAIEALGDAYSVEALS